MVTHYETCHPSYNTWLNLTDLVKLLINKFKVGGRFWFIIEKLVNLSRGPNARQDPKEGGKDKMVSRGGGIYNILKGYQRTNRVRREKTKKFNYTP